VEAGDTLASIARKYYKNQAKAKDILDANYNSLGGKDVIRVGQVLIIP
jgi:nucleoid-associated protein YgaU